MTAPYLPSGINPGASDDQQTRSAIENAFRGLSAKEFRAPSIVIGKDPTSPADQTYLLRVGGPSYFGAAATLAAGLVITGSSGSWTPNGWGTAVTLFNVGALKWPKNNGFALGIGATGGAMYFFSSTADDASQPANYWGIYDPSTTRFTFQSALTVSNALNTGMIQAGATMTGFATTGQFVEILILSSVGVVQAEDRGAATFLPLKLRGTAIYMDATTDMTLRMGDASNPTIQKTGVYTLLMGPSATTPTQIYIGSNTDPAVYIDCTNGVNIRNQAGAATRWTFTTGATPTLAANGTQVLSTRATGWNAPTGTLTRGTFSAAPAFTAAGLNSVAQTLAALITDLRAQHGLIGT